LGKNPSEIARLWVGGQKIEWRKLYTEIGIETPRRISAPTYPFSHRKYGIEAVGTSEPVPEKARASASLRYECNAHNLDAPVDVLAEAWFNLTGVMERIDRGRVEFTTSLSLEACDFLKAHVLFGKAVLSGPTQLAMLFEAIYRALGTIRVEIKSMDFIKPIVVTSEAPLALKLLLAQLPDQQYRFQFQSRPAQGVGEWENHSVGSFTPGANGGPPLGSTDEWSSPELKAMEVDAFYRKLEDMGYRFEDSFKCITDLKAGNGFSVSKIKDLTKVSFSSEHFDLEKSRRTLAAAPVVEPGIIDSCIQMLLPNLPEEVIAEKLHSIYVPVYVGGLTLWAPFPDEMYCYGHRIGWDAKKETFLGGILMKGLDGSLIGKIDKFRLKRVDSGRLLER
jgi:acyl transferase domain-containing protein